MQLIHLHIHASYYTIQHACATDMRIPKCSRLLEMLSKLLRCALHFLLAHELTQNKKILSSNCSGSSLKSREIRQLHKLVRSCKIMHKNSPAGLSLHEWYTNYTSATILRSQQTQQSDKDPEKSKTKSRKLRKKLYRQTKDNVK